jgi:hypothetical protein
MHHRRVLGLGSWVLGIVGEGLAPSRSLGPLFLVLSLEEETGAFGNLCRLNVRQAELGLVESLVTEAAGQLAPERRFPVAIGTVGLWRGGAHEAENRCLQGVSQVNGPGVATDDESRVA